MELDQPITAEEERIIRAIRKSPVSIELISSHLVWLSQLQEPPLSVDQKTRETA